MPSTYTVSPQFEPLIQAQIAANHFSSVEAVVEEGLRLFEARERKLQALRATIDAAIEEGGAVTDEELDASLAETMERLKAEGY